MDFLPRRCDVYLASCYKRQHLSQSAGSAMNDTSASVHVLAGLVGQDSCLLLFSGKHDGKLFVLFVYSSYCCAWEFGILWEQASWARRNEFVWMRLLVSLTSVSETFWSPSRLRQVVTWTWRMWPSSRLWCFCFVRLYIETERVITVLQLHGCLGCVHAGYVILFLYIQIFI